MVDFIGRSEELALFSDGVNGAVVHTDFNMVIGVGELSTLSAARNWSPSDETFSESVIELATGAITSLDINVITASARAYTIPDGVKAEAKKALEWHKEHKRGGTPVGMNTARTLARGGQIGIEKIRHIAKYFPRHEVDKKGKGWKPGDDQFPSNGRIAWALWGGDSAWRWAQAIVERENKKSVTASGYALPGYKDTIETYKTSDDYAPDVNAFKMAHELEPEHGPEFMARVCLDGSGVDRLYKVDFDGTVSVWDDMGWDTLGHVDGDVWTYDRALDDPYDHVEKDHFIIDPESAIIISALMQNDPFGKVSIDDINPEEARLAAYGMAEEDLPIVDYAMTAAGDSMSGTKKAAKPTGAVKSGDGQYTEAERSNIAKSAVRDATGKFASKGSTVVVGNDASKGTGKIVGMNGANQTVRVDINGKVVEVPAKNTTPIDKFKGTQNADVNYGAPLDVEGILGEPRTPTNMPGAQLPGTLPPLTSKDLQGVLNDWAGYVSKERAAFTPLTEGEVRQYAKDTNQKVRPGGPPLAVPPKISTIKDGKIVTQDASFAKSSPEAAPANAPSGPVAQAQGVGPAKPFNPLLPDPNKPPTTFVAPKAPSGGPSTVRQADGPVVKPVDPRNAPGSNVSGKADSRNAPGSNLGPGKIPVQAMPPQASDSRNAPGSNIDGRADSRNAPGSNKSPSVKAGDSRNAPGSNYGPGKIPVQAKPGASKPGGSKPSTGGSFTKDGKYVIQKGDSLWSLADKYKPKGETTASYWAKVMKANPKGNFKSGNPSLIYSGEKVNLPGVTGPSAPSAPKNPSKGKTDDSNYGPGKIPSAAKPVKPADSRNAPGSNKPGKVTPADPRNAPGSNAPGKGDSRNAPGSNASPSKTNPSDAGKYPGYTADQNKKAKDASDKANADAKKLGEAKQAAEDKAKNNPVTKNIGPGKIPAINKLTPAEKANADAKQLGKLKQAAEDKARDAKSAKANADAKELGKAKQSAADKAKAVKDNTGPGKIPAAPAKSPAPGKSANDGKSQKSDAIIDKINGKDAKAASDKANKDAKAVGQAKQAAEDKAKAAKSAKANADAKELGKGKQDAVDKAKAVQNNTGPGKIPAAPTKAPLIGNPVPSKPSVLDKLVKKSGKAGAQKRK